MAALHPLWALMSASDGRGVEGCSVAASGLRVVYDDGESLLCGTSGLWNCPLGYGNQAIAAAVYDAMLNASYLGVWGSENSYARAASSALIALAGPEHYARVLFSTSGGGANDMAMKIARQYQHLVGERQRDVILGLRGAYHGLTYGAFALTDGVLGQRMYGVDRRLVAHVPPNDSAALVRAMDQIGHRVAAVVVEPVLGTGAIPLDPAYREALFAQRAEHGLLLIADEVTTGFWRTGGRAFASQNWTEPADILISAKGLTNGTQAASALIIGHGVARAFSDAGAVLAHAETQAGTAVACSAMLATIDEMRRLDAATLSDRLSKWLDSRLDRLIARAPLARCWTGVGALRAIHLRDSEGLVLGIAEVEGAIAEVRQSGALVAEGPSAIQILPALTYGEADLDELFSCIEKGLSRYGQTRFSPAARAAT